MTQAVVEQLRLRGFDGKGRRLALGGTAEEGVLRRPVDKRLMENTPEALIGTVDIEVLSQIVAVKYEEVQKQAALLVQEVLNICGQPQRYTKASMSRSISYR